MSKKRQTTAAKNQRPPKRLRSLRQRNTRESSSSDEELNRPNREDLNREKSSPLAIQRPCCSSTAQTQQISVSPEQASQNSSNSESNMERNPIHASANFKKHLRDIRAKAISGSWKTFDYEEKATQTRYVNVAKWLRDNKPELKQLLYQGAETGYYKCDVCAEKGCIHLFKACNSDGTRFEVQNIKKHFQSKVHTEIQQGKNFIFSSDWKHQMDVKYLKLMAKHRVSGKMFKSPEFIDMIMSWINEVSNAKIDAETLRKEIPDRTTLQRRLHDMTIEIRGKFYNISSLTCYNMSLQ